VQVSDIGALEGGFNAGLYPNERVICRLQHPSLEYPLSSSGKELGNVHQSSKYFNYNEPIMLTKIS